MTWQDIILRVRALLFRTRVESELEEELSFHLEMEARKHRGSGLDDAAAKRSATIAFGGAERIKEECRDTRGTRWIENFFQDLQFGSRVLRKDRGYSLTVIAALAVGIGANTALFTLFAAVVLKPLPVPSPGGLVSIWRNTSQIPRGGFFPFPDYVYYRDHNSVFSSIAAETPANLRLAGSLSASAAQAKVAEPVMCLFVTANYFTTYGIHPVAGRDFSIGDDGRTAGPYPALLSENYWQRRFGRDTGAIGQTLMLSGIPVTVIGITPRDFMGTRPNVPDVWISMSARGDAQRRALDHTTLCCSLTARLKPGASLQQADADLSILATSLRREYSPSERQWRVVLAAATMFGPNHENFLKMFVVFQAAMGLVLLIACTNVAGLLLGKAAARRREIAVRLSMGATRSRLVRQLMTEGVLISVLAGISALLVSWQALSTINRTVSTSLAAQGGTIAIDVTPDFHVFVYIFLMSILAGVSFALAPALQSTRPDLVSALKEEAGFGVRHKNRLRGWMVSAQIAVCLALLIAAGLLTSNSIRLLSVDPGFETRSVLSMTLSSPEELGYSRVRAREFQTRLYERLRGIRGVLSIGFATRIPLGGNITTTRAVPRDGGSAASGQEQQSAYSYVSQEYFQTLGIPLVRGRAFNTQEVATNAPVIVISEALARRLWPVGDAIGKRISLGSPTEAHFPGQRAPVSLSTEVIGIARDVYSLNLTAPDPGAIYIPKPLDEWNRFVFIRVAGDANRAAGDLVREVHAAEAGLPVSIETLHHMITTGETSAAYRVGAMLFGAIGLIGFALASLGVYSMVAYTASQQTREVGIRMALGAQKADVLRLVMGGGLKWIVTGLLLGIGLGTIISRVLASVLWLQGSGLLDPAVILATAAMTGALALLAAFFPARRATKLDPAVTLRFE